MSHRILIAAGLLLVLVTACVPAVVHGPRVERGPGGGLSASLTAGPRYENGDDGTIPFLFGPLGLNAGYGWTAGRTGGAALRLGVHVPVPVIVLVQPDLYVQLPRRALGGLDGGVGVSLWALEQGRVGMPYLQLGRIADGGLGWYTTQGFFVNDRNADQQARPVLRSDA